MTIQEAFAPQLCPVTAHNSGLWTMVMTHESPRAQLNQKQSNSTVLITALQCITIGESLQCSGHCTYVCWLVTTLQGIILQQGRARKGKGKRITESQLITWCQPDLKPTKHEVRTTCAIRAALTIGEQLSLRCLWGRRKNVTTLSQLCTAHAHWRATLHLVRNRKPLLFIHQTSPIPKE